MNCGGLPEVKPSLKIGKSRATRREYNAFRTLLSVSLPLCFTGATPPRPDPGHTPSLIAGVLKRFGFQPPKVDRKLKRKLKRFTALWCRRNLTPLCDSDVPTFEEWLASTPYSSSRKEELLKTWNKCGRKPNRREFRRIKSFIKDETYPEYKYPRLINSRVDAAKCYFGPVVAAISERLFSLPEFIKTIPVPDRPEVIREKLFVEGDDYVFTDYTSFEAHFTAEVMEMVQFELFKHMCKNLSDKQWLLIYMDVMSGRNVMQFKDVTVKVNACRMSGEMDTSLSNGFCNLMIFLFLAEENGAKDVKGFVEGDDGLFKVSPARCTPTAKQFADLGFTIKIGYTKQLETASFCGQVYDMEDLIVVTDPLEVLARIGWTNKKYVNSNEQTRLQLLRAKGFSLIYQYNGCPMLMALGTRILQLTSGIQIEDRIINALDQWEKEKLKAALAGYDSWTAIPVGDNTRALVEKLYHIPIETQKKIETQFQNISLGTHEMPCLDLVPSVWRDYYDRYSLSYKASNPVWLHRPEGGLLKTLKSYQCAVMFVDSVSDAGRTKPLPKVRSTIIGG